MCTAQQENLYYRWCSIILMVAADKGTILLFMIERGRFSSFDIGSRKRKKLSIFLPSSSIIIFSFFFNFISFLVPAGVTAKLPFKTIVRFKNIVNLCEGNSCCGMQMQRTGSKRKKKKKWSFFFPEIFFLISF